MRRFGLGDVGELVVVLAAIAGGSATARLLEGPGERAVGLSLAIYGLILVVAVDYVVRLSRSLWGAGRVEF